MGSLERSYAEFVLFKQTDEDEARSQLRDSVSAFVRKESASPGQARGSVDAPTLDVERWRRMASLGWLGVHLPEAVGGLGLAHGDLVTLHQEIGRGALTEPLIPVAVLAAGAIALGSNGALKEQLLPRLLSGEALASLAWQRVPGTADAQDVGPTATAAGAGWLLHGEAVFVPLASQAEGLVVAARSTSGVMLFWLNRGAHYTVESAVLADRSDSGSRVRLHDARVTRDDLLADEHSGADLLARVLDCASLAACGELLGAMEQMLQMTVTYMNQRVQFGKPIASFQALQHKAVDVYVQVELSRSVLHRAIALCERPAPPAECAAVVARAKSRCSDAGMFTVKQCIQLHGAIGYTEEYALSRYVRRIVSLAASYGTAAAQRRRYAALALSIGEPT